MNIQEGKEEIKRTLRAYIHREAKRGEAQIQIPLEKQRPVLLIGPPGIGKTAIMAQIAEEEQIGFVSYTMTHHTRQSAIGLPVLKEKEYGGKWYSVTEYTMSEIVASIYDCIKRTGKNTGILFIDEINCVSETLAPMMLQLLQNKTFGSHPIPEGWLIVGAGNPPEYNKSVREMDIVTLDRVKYMNIEADLEIWQKYAAERKVHASICTFLTVYPQYFYQMEQSGLERSFVTARGWEDLSCIVYAYEEMGEMVTEMLISQYVHHRSAAREFCLFYELFHQYEREYQNHYPADTQENRQRLGKAGAGECMAVASVLAAQAAELAKNWEQSWRWNKQMRQTAELVLGKWQEGSLHQIIDEEISWRKKALAVKIQHGVAGIEEQEKEERLLGFLEEWGQEAQRACCTDKQTAQDILERKLDSGQEEKYIGQMEQCINGAYHLLEEAAVGAAKLYFTETLTGHPSCSQFLVEHPQEMFSRQSKELLLSRREEELRRKLKETRVL